MEIYTSADGTSRRDAIGKLSQFLGATSGWALLSLLLSTSTWSRSHDGCEAVTWVGLGGLEPPTSSLSALDIPVVTPVLGGKSGVAAAR